MPVVQQDDTFFWARNEEGELKPFYKVKGKVKQAAWAPLPGTQSHFLSCPVFECLLSGNRGPGKTDALLVDFLQHVGKGYGAEWRGILFRQTYPQLSDVIAKSQKLYKAIFPQANYNITEHKWTFPGGEELLLRHIKTESDYQNWHGHAYPWIGWEELCNWSSLKLYLMMMSCCRSSVLSIPRKYRATTNPYGPNHNNVKARFRLPRMFGKVIRDSVGKDGKLEPERVALNAQLRENRILLDADPGYIDRIKMAARNPAELAAWVEGSWEITAGGMFDDIWRDEIHCVPRVPFHLIPRNWRIDRAFDWGSSKPFSVGWYAKSNGESVVYNGRRYGTVPGDTYRIAEWYGYNGERNEGLKMTAREVAKGIRDREDDWGIRKRVLPGPADASIFDRENGVCISDDMAKEKVHWERADKRPGSRKLGWEKIRQDLKNALPPQEGGPRENPGLFIFDNCPQFFELVPSASRSDKDPDDIDTDSEDHLCDELRYHQKHKPTAISRRSF